MKSIKYAICCFAVLSLLVAGCGKVDQSWILPDIEKANK